MKNQSGYTLIEIMVALFVAGVISLVSYMALESAVDTNNAVSGSAEEFNQVRLANWHFESDVFHLVSRPVSDGYGGYLPSLSLLSGELSMTRISAKRGLVRVDYSLSNGFLYRSEWPVIDRSPTTEPIRTKLIQGVSKLKVQVLDVNNAWVSYWPSSNNGEMGSLPLAIRIYVESKDGIGFERVFALKGAGGFYGA